MSSRTLSGVFCDDIRQEVNGKFSLIGCYGPDLNVSEFPAILSKLCIYVRLMTSAEEPFKSDLQVRVLRDEEVLIDAKIPPRTERPLINVDVKEIVPSITYDALYAHFVLSPIQLDGPCVLRVRATVDGEEIKGLGLIVRQMSEE